MIVKNMILWINNYKKIINKKKKLKKKKRHNKFRKK